MHASDAKFSPVRKLQIAVILGRKEFVSKPNDEIQASV